ncbi:hypothetical protein DPSP01_000920 [Paraphaeosphaeria sporulosa]
MWSAYQHSEKSGRLLSTVCTCITGEPTHALFSLGHADSLRQGEHMHTPPHGSATTRASRRETQSQSNARRGPGSGSFPTPGKMCRCAVLLPHRYQRASFSSLLILVLTQRIAASHICMPQSAAS